MTKECETILSAVEKMQQEKQRVSAGLVMAGSANLVTQHQQSLQSFKDQVLKIREAHAENRQKWNDFLMLDGANLAERVQTQITRAED